MMELERNCATAAHWTDHQYQQMFQIGESGTLSQRLALVADEDSTLAAFLIAHHLDAEWELENVVVDPAFRRKGVGTRLLGELLARVQAANSESVFLEVRESND